MRGGATELKEYSSTSPVNTRNILLVLLPVLCNLRVVITGQSLPSQENALREFLCTCACYTRSASALRWNKVRVFAPELLEGLGGSCLCSTRSWIQSTKRALGLRKQLILHLLFIKFKAANEVLGATLQFRAAVHPCCHLHPHPAAVWECDRQRRASCWREKCDVSVPGCPQWVLGDGKCVGVCVWCICFSVGHIGTASGKTHS